ncbi:hypothetical protein SAMN05216251_108217 [Actinacidiphila alni]|uniref:Uncharacterized protein n=1 Tax=Actinacidiphila alni TaxID=380248 RepID=A0A1I2G378_9ACTN|nr:hypothetical protein [Actinacidiphila alni]SFF11457.1 hypothetical protein SAMN05216251_108217 [Actinacidiphila alni]
MPAYIYTGDDARHYPTLGLDAKPADDTGPATVAEFDARPPADGDGPAPFDEGARYVPDDGRWEPTKKKPTPSPARPEDTPSTDESAAGGQKAGE